MSSHPLDSSQLVTSRPGSAVIVVRSHQQGFAIPIEHVREVTKLSHVTKVPNAPAEVRGAINFRGEVVPVVDLRVLLQHSTRQNEITELVQLLNDREQDHHNWIDELEASVRERRPFTLARDPHQCKFGRWYDTYHPTHAALSFMWSTLDRPHKEIHALADHVLALTQKDDTAGALALIQDARGAALRSLVDMLAEIRRGLLSDTRELAVIMDWKGGKMALCVDAAEAVEDLAGVEFSPLPEVLPASTRQLVTDVMRWPDREEMVLCLNVSEMLAHSPGASEGAAAVA